MALIRPIPTKASTIDIADDSYIMTEVNSTTSTGTITGGTTISSNTSQQLYFIANVKNFNTLALTIPGAAIAYASYGIKSDGSVDVLIPTASMDISAYDYLLMYLRANSAVWSLNFT